jgi:hypothetical protein
MTNDRCSPQIVDRIIAEVFDSPLRSVGFEGSSARKYVRARIPQTYDVIEFYSRKIDLLLVWGLSLNFVPHIEGRSTETVSWHRTARSARTDLRYSEIEDTHDSRTRYAISTLHGPEKMRQAALQARAALLPRALQFFNSVPNLLAIEALFLGEERRPKWGDIFATPQVALAYAFYLARVGKKKEARSSMLEWLKRSDHHRPETNDRLSALFEEAISAPL